MSEYKPTQHKMINLDLDDSDAIVNYLIEFYNKNDVQDEDKLISSLSSCKPLRTAIELQKQKRR